MAGPVLPPLISVRGWSAEDDPRYHAYVGRVRDAGVEVVDLQTGYLTAPVSRSLAMVAGSTPQSASASSVC